MTAIRFRATTAHTQKMCTRTQSTLPSFRRPRTERLFTTRRVYSAETAALRKPYSGLDFEKKNN